MFPPAIKGKIHTTPEKMKPEMKWALAIVLILAALFSTAQVLNQKVDLDARNITVAEALQQINRNYGIKFSYSNNLLPSKKINLQLKDTPLSSVLDRILAGTGLTYQQVGEQVVIKKGASKKAQPGSSIPSEKESAYVTDSLHHTAAYASTELEVIPEAPQPHLQDAEFETEEELDEAYRAEKHRMRRDYEQKMDSIHTAEGRKTFKEKWKSSMTKLHLQYKEVKDMSVQQYKANQEMLRNRKANKDSLNKNQSLNDTIPGDTSASVIQPDSSGHKRDNFQFTVIPPMSTHGSESEEYINDYSVNLLGGYNGGSKYLEAGLLVNVTKYSITGVQISTIANVVKEDMKGVQMSMVNVVGKKVEGVCISSIASVSAEDVWGMQISGIASVAGDTINGAQISGIASYTPTCVYGVQISGIANVAKDGVYGGQIGLINTANHVSGVQVGFLNFSDSIKGVPVGFLSFSRKGYHHPELYYAETMTSNFAFKTGVRAFYNILYTSYQWEPSGYYRWAYGYGVGSEIKMGKRFAMNLDVIGMQINENEGFTQDLNALGQFRMNVGVGLSKTIYLFAGPTFNTMLSTYKQSDGTLGSALIPNKNLIWEDTFIGGDGKPTKVAMWIGFNAGIRF
jgi:hypothetical protein